MEKNKAFKRLIANEKVIALGLLLPILMVLSIGLGLALTFDNTASFTKTTAEKYGTIDIKNAFGLGSTLVQYKLLDNSDICISNCYAEGIATLNTPAKLFEDIEFKNLVTNKNVDLGSYKYYYLEYSDKTEEYTYIDNVKTCKEETNKTDGKLIQICTTAQKEVIGSRLINSNKEDTITYSDNGTIKTQTTSRWKEANGVVLPVGVYYWRIEAKKNPYANIDWIASTDKDNIGDIKMTQWATWTSGFNTGLMAYWDMNNNSGKDLTGNGNDCSGNAANVGYGKNGDGSLYFTNTYWTCKNNINQLSVYQNFTFVMWVNQTAVASYKDIARMSTTEALNSYEFHVGSWNIDTLGFEATPSGGNVDGSNPPNAKTLAGKWSLIVLSFNGTAFRFWQNSTNFKNIAGTGIFSYTGSPNFSFGGGMFQNGGWNFTGGVDEAMIYNRSLSDSEVSDLYNGGAGIFYSPSSVAPTVTLNLPLNNTYFADASVIFDWSVVTTPAGISYNQTLKVYNSSGNLLTPTLCQQEYANVSTSCGGKSTGVYWDNGEWDSRYGVNNTYDGNWGTPGAYNQTDSLHDAILYVNYTKPNGLYNATWNVAFAGDGTLSALERRSLVVNFTCVNNGKNIISIKLNSTTTNKMIMTCWNNTDWIYLTNAITNKPFLVEENMTWGIYNFTDDTYKWNVLVNDGSYTSYSSDGNHTFAIDTQAPIISANINDSDNFGLGYVNKSITLNWTVVHSGNITLWYNYVTATNNTLYGAINFTTFNITSTSLNQGLNLYVNDSAGNQNVNSLSWVYKAFASKFNYNATVYESENELISLEFSYNSSLYTLGNVYLNYDGVDYLATSVGTGNTVSSKTMLIPIVTSPTTKNFYWNIELINSTDTIYFNTTAKTQSIIKGTTITVDASCGAGYSSALNFTSYFETNRTAINFTSVKYYVTYGLSGNSSAYQINSTVTNVPSFSICINNSQPYYKIGYGELQYSVTGEVDRRYYIFSGTRITNVTVGVPIYSLDTPLSTSFLVTAQSTDLSPYENYYVGLLRWYPEINSYQTVELGKTDDRGQTVLRVKTEDVDYRFAVYQSDGTLVNLYAPVRLICQTSPCVYTLYVDTNPIDLSTYLNIQNGLTFDSATNRFTFVWNDPSQESQTINLTVWKDTSLTSYIVCSNTATGYTGVLICDVTGTTGKLRAEAWRTASPTQILAQLVKDIGETFVDVGGGSIGLFIGAIILILFALIGIVSPVIVVILGIVALIPLYFLGNISWIVLTGIGVIGGVVLHFLKRIG